MKKETFKFNPDKRYKVYFNDKTRTPILGKFVKLRDHDEMIKKGFVRFVSAANMENFEKTNHVMHSRLFSVSDFHSIKAVEYETV